MVETQVRDSLNRLRDRHPGVQDEAVASLTSEQVIRGLLGAGAIFAYINRKRITLHVEREILDECCDFPELQIMLKSLFTDLRCKSLDKCFFQEGYASLIDYVRASEFATYSDKEYI